MRNAFSYLLQVKSFTFFTALFVSLLILQVIYQNADFELVEMNKLIISQATADGVSIQSRIDLFYGLIFRLIALLLINLTVFHFVFEQIGIRKFQKSVLFLLSSAGISILILQVIGVKTEVLIHLIFFVLIYKIVIYGLANSKIKSLKLFRAEVLSNSILAYGFLGYFAVLYLTGTDLFLMIYILSVFFLTALFPLLKYFTKFSIRQINYLLVPIIFLSVLSFLSIEMVMFQYQKGYDILGYRKLYLLLFLVFSIVFYGIIYFKKKTLKNASSIFRKVLAPSVIIAYCLLIYYFPIAIHNTEMFELGNPANALMNVFKFGEIPFVDFMSSHMFSEQWYGIIYSLIFGYDNSLDFQIYFFFNRLLFLLVVYVVLNKLFKKPAFSLLFVLVFPFLTEVFSNDLIFCLLPFFIVQNIVKESKSKLYFYLFGSVILLIVWKIDTGYAALVSTFFYFIFLAITQSIKVNWKHLLKGFLFTVSIVLALLLSAILLRGGETILENFKTALHYVSGNQAHGYTEIAHNYPHQFFISYFFLPLISVLSVLYIGFRLWKKESLLNIKKADLLILHASLFFFLISLANAQRGIVRHGYAENNDGAIITTFYVALAMLMVFLFRNHVVKNRLTFFYVACFSLFLIFRFFPYQPAYGTFDKAIKKNAFISLNVDIAAKTELRRTKANHGFYHAQLKDFKNFVDDNLTEEETFLDFSNTPMLYYYSGKKVPGYFCQNLQNSIDDFSQLQLLKSVNPQDVPMVVFSSYPKSWFDETDGIPNSMRYYLVAEYIYKNYEPYAIISNKRIWMAKDFKIKKDYNSLKDTVSNVPVEYNYKKTAHFIHEFYQRNEFEDLEKISEWKSGLNQPISIRKSSKKTSNAYLLFEFSEDFETSTKSLILQDSLGNKLDMFKFEINKKLGNKYMIRISNSYHWHNGNAVSFLLEDDNLKELEKITLFKDARFED
ncbi:hypothetical protein [Brumimicrobium oceani]|uniref:Uncharacterized protein n=1 Tax=Brumimicrobium oceani TaxID=2100725 RepID=A0A2U2XB21_9FLAO|nr:hypothetical protein [Brumimicrobium oceani]PWH84901.1 hypothetical protein DIT68_12215 [Brumimicrobium oceani]